MVEFTVPRAVAIGPEMVKKLASMIDLIAGIRSEKVWRAYVETLTFESVRSFPKISKYLV